MPIVIEDKKLRIKKKDWNLFLVALFYKIVLDFSYFTISKLWAYYGLIYSLNSTKLVESYLIFFVVFIFMPKNQKHLSSVMLWMFIVLSFVPFLTIYSFLDQSRAYAYAVMAFWVFIIFLIKLPSVSIVFLSKIYSRSFFYLFAFGLIASVIFLIWKYLGFTIGINLDKVYDIRSNYSQLKVPWSGYLFTWVAHIVNPIIFAIFLTRKKILPTIIIILLELVLFSQTGNKSYLFALPFVLVLMWIVRKKNPYVWLCAGLSGIVLSGLISYWVIGDTRMLSYFTRRTLLLPAQISFMYYEFFSANGFVFLSQHSIIPNFMDYPYDLKPAYLIGSVYFNNSETSANSGIYGDAFMNFGYAGFVIWGIVLAIILRMIDGLSKNKDKVVLVSLVAMPVISLINSALLTCLLTHGILLSMLIMYLLPPKVISSGKSEVIFQQHNF